MGRQSVVCKFDGQIVRRAVTWFIEGTVQRLGEVLRTAHIGIAAGFVAMAAIALLVALRPFGSDQPPAEPRSPVLATGTALPAGFHAPASSSRTQSVRPEGGESGKLIEGYNKKGSWRPLVANPGFRSAPGGGFYAERMLSFCRGMAALAVNTEPEPRTPARDEAARGLAERCGEFVSSDYEQIATLGSDAADTLVKAAKAHQSARVEFARHPAQREGLEQAIRQVIDSRDPLLLDNLGLRLITYKSRNGGNAVFYFQGQEYPLGRQPDLGMAVHLLPCELGLQCDASEPSAQMRCDAGAGCEGGRYEEVREMLKGKPKEYETILRLARAMADAVRRGDASAFMPP